MAPFSKTGGLGDVAGALPKALAARGHRVLAISPRYKPVPDSRPLGLRARFHLFGMDHEVSFHGLESLERLAWTFAVRNNPELASIEALSGVTEIRSEVTFDGNPKLPQCQIDGWLGGLGLTCECTANDGAASCQ